MKSIIKPVFVAVALMISGYAAVASDDVPPPGDRGDKKHPRNLPDLPTDKWLAENPYRGNVAAVKEGERLYSSTGCKDCHGLQAVSGGITPDLRKMEPELDGVFLKRIRSGTGKGMPSFDKVLTQEAMWAIRSYLDVRWAQYNHADVKWAQKEEFKEYKPDFEK